MFLQRVQAFWKRDKQGSITIFHSRVNRIIYCGEDRKISAKFCLIFSNSLKTDYPLLKKIDRHHNFDNKQKIVTARGKSVIDVIPGRCQQFIGLRTCVKQLPQPTGQQYEKELHTSGRLCGGHDGAVQPGRSG
ncbi:hypothetical protein [[Erwinia] mediterraneensis]|uniref:hypothetical protein n=1 Tax=[Erwinia] mediterraneensis TaxID=2161819 RepID=UPI0013EF2650|nr:hypothetical protein [[Erwinia] mediterraneensis]